MTTSSKKQRVSLRLTSIILSLSLALGIVLFSQSHVRAETSDRSEPKTLINTDAKEVFEVNFNRYLDEANAKRASVVRKRITQTAVAFSTTWIPVLLIRALDQSPHPMNDFLAPILLFSPFAWYAMEGTRDISKKNTLNSFSEALKAWRAQLPSRKKYKNETVKFTSSLLQVVVERYAKEGTIIDDVLETDPKLVSTESVKKLRAALHTRYYIAEVLAPELEETITEVFKGKELVDWTFESELRARIRNISKSFQDDPWHRQQFSLTEIPAKKVLAAPKQLLKGTKKACAGTVRALTSLRGWLFGGLGAVALASAAVYDQSPHDFNYHSMEDTYADTGVSTRVQTQSPFGSCTDFATTGLIEWAATQKYGVPITLSRATTFLDRMQLNCNLFAKGNAARLTEASDFSTVLDSMSRGGALPDRTLPYSVLEHQSPLPENLTPQDVGNFLNKIPEWWRLGAEKQNFRLNPKDFEYFIVGGAVTKGLVAQIFKLYTAESSHVYNLTPMLTNSKYVWLEEASETKNIKPEPQISQANTLRILLLDKRPLFVTLDVGMLQDAGANADIELKLPESYSEGKHAILLVGRELDSKGQSRFVFRDSNGIIYPNGSTPPKYDSERAKAEPDGHGSDGFLRIPEKLFESRDYSPAITVARLKRDPREMHFFDEKREKECALEFHKKMAQIYRSHTDSKIWEHIRVFGKETAYARKIEKEVRETVDAYVNCLWDIK